MSHPTPLPGGADAVILVSHGNRGVGETAEGERVKLQFLRSVGRPCCGDLVAFEKGRNRGNVVTAILPRRNEFARANQMLQKQVIAANLDQVLVVIAPQPLPSQDLVERYLVAIHSLGIEPLIIVNKSELLQREALDHRNPLGHIDDYRSLGYRVILTSCKTEHGLDQLRPQLHDRVSIFVGQSGVGKSSLIKALVPDIDIQIGDLSEASGKGKHTTTATRMYQIADDGEPGGRLIDSPGVWEYGLWEIEASELAFGFVEFREHLQGCRFNDCLHDQEPDCAVKAARDSGAILPWRYEAYLRLLSQQ